MTLQELHELTGKVLKERPDLSKAPVTTETLFTPDWEWQIVLASGTLQILASTDYNSYGEQIWQLQ